MNKLIIIGNLTRDPERRITPSGEEVADFTVAVNRRGGKDADYFRVTAWGKTAQNCAQYLDKGRKVCVIGPVSVQTWTGRDGAAHSELTVSAQEVEFLSPRSESSQMTSTPIAPRPLPRQERMDLNSGYTPVTDDELPF